MNAAATPITIELASPADIARFGGRKVTLSLAPADVTSSVEIDSYLPGYQPFGGFRGDEVAPTNPLVDKDFGTYRIYGSNNVFRRVRTQTSRTAPVGEVDPETSLANYNALPYGLGSFIPAATENQSAYNLRQAAARVIADKLALDRECRIWAYLTTLGNWASAQVKTLGAGFNWNGGVNANPVQDLQGMIRASAQPVTAIYMSLEAGHALLNHDTTRDYLRAFYGDSPLGDALRNANGGQPVDTSVEFLIPGLPVIKIAGAKVLNETTGLLDEIIGRTNVVGVSLPPFSTREFDSIQTVRTLRTKGPSGTGWTSREYFVNHRGVDGGTMLVAGYTEDVKFVANNAGFLLRSVLT